MSKKQLIKDLYYRSCRMIEKLHDLNLDDNSELVKKVYKFNRKMYLRCYREFYQKPRI